MRGRAEVFERPPVPRVNRFERGKFEMRVFRIKLEFGEKGRIGCYVWRVLLTKWIRGPDLVRRAMTIGVLYYLNLNLQLFAYGTFYKAV